MAAAFARCLLILACRAWRVTGFPVICRARATGISCSTTFARMREARGVSSCISPMKNYDHGKTRTYQLERVVGRVVGVQFRRGGLQDLPSLRVGAATGPRLRHGCRRQRAARGRERAVGVCPRRCGNVVDAGNRVTSVRRVARGVTPGAVLTPGELGRACGMAWRSAGCQGREDGGVSPL